MTPFEIDENQLSTRFIRYAKIDTQSDPGSNTFPSTEKQKNLARLLVTELKEIGISDVEMDTFGYVYATLPSNSTKKVPVICFCSHMDTSPDCSGYNVIPIIHRNYQGEDLVLPKDPSVVIRQSDHPDLSAQFGNDIITASGDTLLGADNKAGLTAIVEAIKYLAEHPKISHGTIKILFTPDEEIGKGVEYVDLKKLGADFGYTIDGETLGSIEDETFSADGGTLTIHGVSSHPGFAKGKMESAIKILAEIIHLLPANVSPERTESKMGFIHPVDIGGNVECASAGFILRDFDEKQLESYSHLITGITKETLKKYPNSSFEWKVMDQYRNMKLILDDFPEVIENGIEAIQRAGIQPKRQSIRGGTDGSRLSFMGLPCPNLFAGEHAFHSKQEWVSVQDMVKATETIVNLVIIWEEKAG